MVGDYATNWHGYQRFTGDIVQFVPGWTDFHFNNGLRLDILSEMKGLEGDIVNINCSFFY